MAIGDDMSDWAPGQPPPWLAAYGPVPPPIDDSIAGAPGAAPSEQAPPFQLPPQQPGLGIPSSIVDAAATAPGTHAGVPSIPPPIDASIAGAPGAPSSPRPPTPGAPPAPAEPPWLQGPPDAISGVNERAPAPALAATAQQHVEGQDRAAGVALDPNAPIADRQAAWQRLSPEQRTNLVNSADPKQLAAIATAAMAPEELATIGIRHQQAQLHEDSAARLELARKADEDAQRAHAAQQMAAQQTTAALAQVDADSKALSMEKVDPAEHGVGHFIASVLTSAIGGAMSQYSGGRNLALEELDKQTQRRIDAQKSNIANKWQGLNFKRNLITEQYTRGVDEARADATYRISQYDRALGELATKAQDYDPAGTTAMRIATTGQQIQAQRAQALQTFGQQDFNNRIKAAEVNQKAADAALKQQNEEANRKAQQHQHDQTIGLGYANNAETMREHDMADARAREAAAAAAADRADKKTDKAETDWGEKGLGDPATGEPMVTAQGAPMIAQARELAAKGDTAGAADLRKQAALKYGVKIDNKEDATKVQQQIAFAQGMSDLRARIHGQLDGDPGITNREAWAGIDTDFQNLKIQYIRLNEGKPSSREMDAMSEVFGASPSELNVRAIGQGKLKAHIDHVVDNAINDTSTLLKAKKVEGGWQPTPLTTYKAAPTPADTLLTAALSAKPSDQTMREQVAEAANQPTHDYPAFGVLSGLGINPPLFGAASGGVGDDGSDRAAEQRQTAIQQLARQATSNPAEAPKYAAALQKIAKDGITGADRDLAKSMLAEVGATQRTALPDEPEPQTSEPDEPEPNSSPAVP